MNDIIDYYLSGGMTMLWITFLVLPVLGMAFAHMSTGKRWTLVLALCVALLPVACGTLGMMLGRWHTDQAVATLSPDDGERQQMRQVGYSESMVPLKYGGAVTGLGLMITMIGEVRRRRRSG